MKLILNCAKGTALCLCGALAFAHTVIGQSYEIPDAALTRPLGAGVHSPCSPRLSQVCEGAKPSQIEALHGGYPMSLGCLGIPLGGIGAGSFMVNQYGTFGPWNFGGEVDEHWEVRVLQQAAFHIREQVGSGPALVKTLAVPGPKTVGKEGPVPDRSWGGPLPAWKALQPGEGTYLALYPFGWIRYKPFQTEVSLRFFSPIVAREQKRSSLPLAYFDMHLVNRNSASTKLVVMFTMPNAGPHEGRTPATVRSDLESSYFDDGAIGIQGVTLRSDGEKNTPDAKGSEWTIAAHLPQGATFSYVTSWNGAADGADVYRDFQSTGQLGNKALDSSHSAAAIEVSVELQPGQEVTIPFVLSWDFPQIAFADNKLIWMRRYTDFYGARETRTNEYIAGTYPFHRSRAIAEEALLGHDENLRAVEAWWRPFATDRDYPLVLRTAALNQLYQIVFNSSLWEGGLVSNEVQPSLGSRTGISEPDLHLFATVDSGAGGNSGNSLDVNSYNYLSYNLLFPFLERDRLVAFAEAMELAPKYTDIAADMKAGPYVVYKDLPACAAGKDNFIDIPSKFVMRAYAYARLNHDEAFLRRMWPAMRKAFSCLSSEVPAGKHLPVAAEMGLLAGDPGDPAVHRPITADMTVFSKLRFPNTYDAIATRGPDAYDSGLYLLALEIMIEAGKRQGEPSARLADQARELVEAKAEFEHTFWNARQGYYAYTVYPVQGQDGTLLDTFYAQHIAERLHLPDLVNDGRYRQQLGGTYAAFTALHDGDGQTIGAPNMIVGKGVKEWPMLGPLGSVQEEGVWIGTNYFVASTYVAAGKRFGSLSLTTDGISLGSAVATQAWLNPKNSYAFNVPMSWDRDDPSWYIYPAYERELAIWDLIDSIKTPSFVH